MRKAARRMGLTLLLFGASCERDTTPPEIYEIGLTGDNPYILATDETGEYNSGIGEVTFRGWAEEVCEQEKPCEYLTMGIHIEGDRFEALHPGDFSQVEVFDHAGHCAIYNEDLQGFKTGRKNNELCKTSR